VRLQVLQVRQQEVLQEAQVLPEVLQEAQVLQEVLQEAQVLQVHREEPKAQDSMHQKSASLLELLDLTFHGILVVYVCVTVFTLYNKESFSLQ